MREVCAFSGMGKTVRLYFMNFFVSPCLFIDSLFMYLLDSIYVFLDLCTSFSGVVVRLVSAERGVLEIKTRREDAKRMFQSKTKPKDCCNLRRREKAAGERDGGKGCF